MSKFNKFVNHPKWFFRDAFKKRELVVSSKLNYVNNYLKDFGIPIQLDLHIVENSFVNTAMRLSHDNRMGQQIVKLVLKSQKSNKISESHELQQVSKKLKRINISEYLPYIAIKHSFEVSVSPPHHTLKDIKIGSSGDDEILNKPLPDPSQNEAVKSTLPSNVSTRAKQLFSWIHASS